jgi:aspartyl/asparaginyl beta-hydroxylase (cupin superfamily)
MAKSRYFLSEEDTYTGPEPYFFNNQDYAWVKTLEDNWHIITEEFQDVLCGKKAIKLSSSNPPYLSGPNAWKNVYFLNFMWKYHKNCKEYPKTYELLGSIPNLTFAEFTVLEPSSQVMPHIGETNTTIRGHLGIQIPGELPEAGIRVGDEEKSWENGKVILFSDAYRHTVWNNTKERRFVLVFDVVRDEFAGNKTWVCAQCLSALTVKAIDEKFSFFKKLPSVLLNFFHQLISIVWFVYLPLQRRFNLP